MRFIKQIHALYDTTTPGYYYRFITDLFLTLLCISLDVVAVIIIVTFDEMIINDSKTNCSNIWRNWESDYGVSLETEGGNCFWNLIERVLHFIFSTASDGDDEGTLPKLCKQTTFKLLLKRYFPVVDIVKEKSVKVVHFISLPRGRKVKKKDKYKSFKIVF